MKLKVGRLVRLLGGVAAVCLAAAPLGAQGQEAQDSRSGAVEFTLPAKESLARMRRFEAGVAKLAPQRKGVRDAYVIAASLYDEHVFENEAEGAAQVLSARFGAQGRTLVLSNGQGPGTAPRYGAASANEIVAAIARVGEMLDPDEDFLVLYLTSHGRNDGALSIREQNRQDGILRPNTLRTALDESGIRRRFVIVSACYSGSFVPALNTEETIVVTAAAFARTSFGCEAQRDWTYFGDAFINQALRANRPLGESFATARDTIMAWETRDSVKPSYPMYFVGGAAGVIADSMTGQAPPAR